MAEISIVIAFLAGIGSFFAPCILPMVPAFLAYISGTTLSEIKTKNNEKKEHHVNTTFDHLAFSANNIHYYEKVLKDNHIPFTFREVPEIGTKQLFFKDPVGNGIELIFIK